MSKKRGVTINQDTDLDMIDAQLDAALDRLVESTEKVNGILETYSQVPEDAQTDGDG